MPRSRLASSSARPARAVRRAMTFTRVDMSKSVLRRHRSALKRLDDASRDRFVGPGVLAGNELAVLNHVRVEIDRCDADVGAGRAQRVGHVEVQLGVKDVVLDDLLL